jgi:hypothetical protein
MTSGQALLPTKRAPQHLKCQRIANQTLFFFWAKNMGANIGGKKKALISLNSQQYTCMKHKITRRALFRARKGEKKKQKRIKQKTHKLT